MLPTSAKDATNFGTHAPLTQNEVTQLPLFIFLTILWLCNTHPQPTPLWGLAALSLIEPSSVFAYAMPVHTAHIHWFFLKIPQFLLFLLLALP